MIICILIKDNHFCHFPTCIKSVQYPYTNNYFHIKVFHIKSILPQKYFIYPLQHKYILLLYNLQYPPEFDYLQTLRLIPNPLVAHL